MFATFVTGQLETELAAHLSERRFPAGLNSYLASLGVRTLPQFLDLHGDAWDYAPSQQHTKRTSSRSGPTAGRVLSEGSQTRSSARDPHHRASESAPGAARQGGTPRVVVYPDRSGVLRPGASRVMLGPRLGLEANASELCAAATDLNHSRPAEILNHSRPAERLNHSRPVEISFLPTWRPPSPRRGRHLRCRGPIPPLSVATTSAVGWDSPRCMPALSWRQCTTRCVATPISPPPSAPHGQRTQSPTCSSPLCSRQSRRLCRRSSQILCGMGSAKRRGEMMRAG